MFTLRSIIKTQFYKKGLKKYVFFIFFSPYFNNSIIMAVLAEIYSNKYQKFIF